MTARDTLLVRMAHAHNKATEVLEEHGATGSEPEERGDMGWIPNSPRTS